MIFCLHALQPLATPSLLVARDPLPLHQPQAALRRGPNLKALYGRSWQQLIRDDIGKIPFFMLQVSHLLQHDIRLMQEVTKNRYNTCTAMCWPVSIYQVHASECHLQCLLHQARQQFDLLAVRSCWWLNSCYPPPTTGLSPHSPPPLLVKTCGGWGGLHALGCHLLSSNACAGARTC